MPNKKISQLPVITSLTGTETIPALKDSIVKKTTTGVVTNRMKDLARYSNYSAIQDIKESAKETLFEGLSAGSVLQQDITAVSGALHRSPNAVNAMFVYDTSKDSDGGAWTEKCQHTSWYNEPLSGKWLGAQPSESNARGYNATLGSELVTNGTFDSNVNGWSGFTWATGGYANLTSSVAWSNAGQSLAISAGKQYKITFTMLSTTAPVRFYMRTMPSGTLFNSTTYYSYAGQYSTMIVVPTNDTSVDLIIGSISTPSYVSIFDNISLKEVISTSTQTNDYFQLTADGKFYALSKNLLTTTNTLATQTQWLTSGTYTLSSTTASTGSVAISGAATATHTAGGTATTFTVSTSGSATFTVTGSVTNAQLEVGSVATVYKANASTNRYTEVFRGNKAEFPKLAGIVAEDYSITIYDLTESSRPMWMRFLKSQVQNTASTIIGDARPVSSIYVVNSILSIGSGINGGFRVINFINDNGNLYWNQNIYTSDLNIANRNSIAKSNTISSITGYIIGSSITSVAMTITKDAPIDVVTGLKVPIIAVASDVGISIIKNRTTVYYATQNISFNKVYITPKLLIASRNSDSTLYYYPNPSNISANFTLLTESSGIDFNQGNTTVLNQKNRSELSRASGAKIQLLKNNESLITKGVTTTITPTYNTGYMVGDVRRSYLTSVAPGTVTSTAYAARGLFLDGTTKGIWLDPSDLGTMFQYSTGSTAVTGVEQQVGLILDKSLGNPWIQKIKDPNLNVVSNWSNTAAFSNGRYISGNSSDTTYAPTSGKLYRYTYVVSKASTGGLAIYIAGVQKGTSSAIAAGTYTGIVVSTGGTKIAEFYDPGWGWNGEIEYFSVEELTGNYAYAPDAARPTLSARYNLLTKTENFSSYPDWVTFNTSVDANNILTATSSGSIRYIYHSAGIGSVSGNYTLITKLKAGTTNWAWVVFSDRNTNSAGAYFDLQNGVVGNITQGGTAFSLIGTPTISLPDSNGYRTCMITISSVGGALIAPSIGISDSNGSPYVTSGKTIALGGADIRPADQAGLPYQRVNTATDYDSDITKFPYYLKFSGAQYLQTNSINFNYTDKMFVSAGVRKLSLSGVQAIFELSQGVTGVSGTFNHFASASTSKCNFGLTGATGTASGFDLSGTDSIATFVTSCRFDLSGASRDTEIFPKVNGVTPFLTGTNDTTAGTGNFNNNYSLYIGARAGNQYFFIGQLSQLLIAGKAVTTKQIQDAENYIEQKTYGNYPEFLVDASGNQIVDASGNPLYANVTYQY